MTKDKISRTLKSAIIVLGVLLIFFVSFNYVLFHLRSHLEGYFSKTTIQIFFMLLVLGLGLLVFYKRFTRTKRLAEPQPGLDNRINTPLRSVVLFVVAVIVNLFLIQNFSVKTVFSINLCLLLIGIVLLALFWPEYLRSYKRQFFFEVDEDLKKMRPEEKASREKQKGAD